MTPSPGSVRNDLQDQLEVWVLAALLPCRRHPLLLLVGLAAGLVLGHLYLKTQPPVYQSTAQVLVLRKQPDSPLSGGLDHAGSAGFEDYLSTHQGLIRSAVVLDLALRKPR